jgi:hypothetical protein
MCAYFQKYRKVREMNGNAQLPWSGNTRVNSSTVEEAWASIDWFTGFISNDWGHDTWFDLDHLQDLAEGEHGAKELPWVKQGFVGRSRGRVSAGEREDGTLREVTGPLAHRYSEMVAEDYHLIRPSRLDIAFTFRLQEYQPAIAKYYYTMGSSLRGGACRPRQRRFFSNQQGGETLYIGSVSSDGMLRLYDKQEEQKGQGLYERCWRLEFQTRREKARVLWAAINGSTDRERAIRGVLKGECEREGILGFIDWNSSAVKLAAPDRPAQYLERRLEWLERQVRPTVRELAQEGYGAAVLRSLGLDPDKYSW